MMSHPASPRKSAGSRVASATAIVATGLGLGSAALSAYWAIGGTALLDTIGGEIERWGRERGTSVVVALWLIVAVKAAVALAAPVLAAQPAWLPRWTAGRAPRILSWIAAVALTLYGGILTVVGLLVQAGVIAAAPDADPRALAWHAYVWDPWFLAWGSAFLVCLWCTRPRMREPG